MTHPSNTVSVIGADGMLGRAVVRALEEGAKDFNIHKVTVTNLETCAPYIINCAGIVRGRSDITPERTVKVNAVYSHWLVANVTELKRLVTVSTDCVFDGLSGPYSEGDQATPVDLYARSKLAGEIFDNEKVLTVRTSFIGFGQRGLLRWLLTQPENASVSGYIDHVWNGFYVGNVAKALVYLCLRTRLNGMLHFSGNIMSKWQLLKLVTGMLRPDIEVVQREVGARNHVLVSSRLDDFDFGQLFETSMRQLYVDYEEWGKDYLCSLS